MVSWTFEELHAENEKNALGLQYTIAERERLRILVKILSEQISETNAHLIARLTKCIIESPSERFQDVFALLASSIREGGFFVEFGACDGVAANNTLILERYFGWTGILGEPSRHWHDQLHRNRRAQIDERCVSSHTGGALELFESERPTNSSTEKDHAYLGKVVRSYDVETVSLMDLLSDHRAPRVIDFMSIDTEGHEMDVLRTFDFDRYRFGFLTIEQHAQVVPENDVRPLLEAAGYAVVFPREEGRPLPLQVTGFDLFFVPKEHPWATAYRTSWMPR